MNSWCAIPAWRERGISAARLRAFAQEDAGARSSYTGTGLGLAIVKELVEKMDGTIRLESRKGAGTTFTVCLTFTRDRQAQRDEDAAACRFRFAG